MLDEIACTEGGYFFFESPKTSTHKSGLKGVFAVSISFLEASNLGALRGARVL